ncbi:hypothetical protein M878_06815 [Streptomyces roseochromogenus subsp. oscitans DS 12.976]|uniref:3-carboxy-cis,cis-muconate cycloisomerase n=1 Tax=Streptomyces roseochromogenus subsp. oscitans DS 12.976 TaxID=1352936 RepID=V6KT05_STRRC|nr:hypothetical protein M878_06815 [Streptomyces roseochromogenus subsp. oscitans DS 12.976]
MTAPATPDDRDSDTGLLAPGWTGSPAAHATGDSAYLRALLDAEAALTRAQAALGLAPAEAADAVTRAADPPVSTSARSPNAPAPAATR